MTRSRKSTKQYWAQLQVSPWRLFFYAQAFRFSSGKGHCFSPGFKALCRWQWHKYQLLLMNRPLARWWRTCFEKV